MSFMADIKTHIEGVSGLDAYPFNIPQGTPLPAIVYLSTNYGRHGSSNLDDTNISDRNIQITVIAESPSELINFSEAIVNSYENFSGPMGGTNIMIARVLNTIPLYNKTQNVYEEVIDIKFTIIN